MEIKVSIDEAQRSLIRQKKPSSGTAASAISAKRPVGGLILQPFVFRELPSAIAADIQLAGPTSDGLKTRDTVSTTAEITGVGGAAYVLQRHMCSQLLIVDQQFGRIARSQAFQLFCPSRANARQPYHL